MTVFKIVPFARLQVTSGNVKTGKRTNLKELLMPHKLPQGAPAESVKGEVKIGKTCLPPIVPLCLSNVLKEG